MDASQEQISNIINKIFHQVAPEILYEKLDMNLPLREQIEIDSLDFYKIIVSLQKQTGIFVPDSKLAQFTSLNDLINYILEKSKKRGVLNEFKT